MSDVLDLVKCDVFHECDYCGGWTERDASCLYEGGSVADMTINDPTTGVHDDRHVCTKCLIRVLDKVLGEPFKNSKERA